jgi:tRNA modification GTPase
VDTIAAIVTAPGYGGIAVVRVSGRDAFSIAGTVFRPSRGEPLGPADDHRTVVGHARRGGQLLDRCVAAVFCGPRSYTGEDTVELSCHGGPVVSRLVLDALLEAGARFAEPGEFTRRAFEHGKLDLVQAEAVLDLILAHGDRSAALALSQLSGRLSERIRGYREALVGIAAELEAELEFPDEDLSFEQCDALRQRLDVQIRDLAELLDTYEEGRHVQHGFTCVLAGAVNVGKSTLANALLGQDRSIVTPLPGTTRDLVESRASVRGLSVMLVDTAGLRESTDPVEQEGVRRSRASLQGADLGLLVVDSSAGLAAEDERLIAELDARKTPLLVAWNKTDLPGSRPVPELPAGRFVALSALNGDGLEPLRDRIAASLAPVTVGRGERVLLSSLRQRDALSRAQQAMAAGSRAMAEGLGSELVVEELRLALRELGRVLGETTPDDILDDLFSRFCIGK